MESVIVYIYMKVESRTLKVGETPSLFLDHKQFQQLFSEILLFLNEHMGWKKALLLLLHVQTQLRGCGTHRIGTTDLAQNEVQALALQKRIMRDNFTMVSLQKALSRRISWGSGDWGFRFAKRIYINISYKYIIIHAVT